MYSRFGLRERMAVSYVLVSAVAVVVVEIVLLAAMIPRIRSARDSAVRAQQGAESSSMQSKTEVAAVETAASLSNLATYLDTVASGRSEPLALLKAVAAHDADLKNSAGSFGSKDSKDMDDVAKAVATIDGRVVASGSTEFPPGSMLPAEAIGESRSGTATVHGRSAGWATRPVALAGGSSEEHRVIGVVYVRATPTATVGERSIATVGAEVTNLLLAGMVVLVLLLPVGALFGLLTTGRLIGRVHRLAAGGTAMADGDLKARIPVAGVDELGTLEEAFNAMAQRLEAAVEGERKLAGAEARRAERTRIARELHDSISQDLFSASLVAGGLRKALPASSDLRHQAEAMERSLGRTMREMRAMLLELRPVALEDAGLAEALDELCRTYESRLGISITVQVDRMRLEPAIEHVVLRVVQEALGNAVRHGEPGAIDLRVVAVDDRVTVTVHDDGSGFDPSRSGRRHGMGLAMMRERIGELGGTFEVLSAPQRGTTVRVSMPGNAGGPANVASVGGPVGTVGVGGPLRAAGPADATSAGGPAGAENEEVSGDPGGDG